MSVNWGGVITELRQRGWGKSQFAKPGQPGCLYLAACRAAGDVRQDRQGDEYPDYDSALVQEMGSVIAPIIAEQFSDRLSDPDGCWDNVDWGWRFNDHPDTTLDDVILVLEKARAEG